MDTTALEAAFRKTIYRVMVPEGCFDLRIGVADPVFDSYLHAQGIHNWGIITACNPGAVRLSDEANTLLQTELCEKLRALGWHSHAACNLDEIDTWPPEPGRFIPQIAQEKLCALACDFSQLAIVWGETGGPPQLVWLSDDRPSRVM